MKKKILLSALLILTCTLTACGKKDRKDIDKDLGGNTTENVGTSDKMSDEEIPESLSYTAAGTTVEAKVSAEGYGQVPVYELEKKEGSDEWVRSYAELLFDGGEYINVKPYEFCSKAELEAEKKIWQEKLSELTISDAGYQRIATEIQWLESEIEKSGEDNADVYLEDKLIYETDSYSEDDSEIVKSHEERALIRGEINGDIWQLVYNQSRSDIENEGETDSEVHVPVLIGICPEKFGYSNYADKYTSHYENICDKETAQRDAQEFLDRLGFNDMELIFSYELIPQVWDEAGNYSIADYCDGYGMVFAPMLGNIKSPCNMTDIEASGDGTNFITQPRIFIRTGRDGVFSFEIVGGYEIKETLTENSSMLTFEQIDAIAKDEFEKAGFDQRAKIIQVNFGYMYVSYEDSSYAAVPVWCYCAEESYDETIIKPILTICALDGTVIETNRCWY